MGGETVGNRTPHPTPPHLEEHSSDYVQKHFSGKVFRMQIPGLFPLTLMRGLAITLLKTP